MPRRWTPFPREARFALPPSCGTMHGPSCGCESRQPDVTKHCPCGGDGSGASCGASAGRFLPRCWTHAGQYQSPSGTVASGTGRQARW